MDCSCSRAPIDKIARQYVPAWFFKVLIPAFMGDDTTYPPKAGMYRNALVQYEANNHVYIYSSDGLFTYIQYGSSGGTTTVEFNNILNRPSYAGATITSSTNIPIVPTKTSELLNDSGFAVANIVDETLNI